MRLHNVKKLQDYGRYTSKVARPALATKVLGDFPDFDEHSLWLGIHLVSRRSEDVVDPVSCAERDVILQDPRIEIVIAILVELNWIDKDACDNDGAAPPRFFE